MEQLKQPLSLLFSLASDPFILAGWILIIVNLFLYYLIISRAKLTYAFLAPRSLAYILVILFSCFILKEVITIKTLLGIAVILIGIYLIS